MSSLRRIFSCWLVGSCLLAAAVLLLQSACSRPREMSRGVQLALNTATLEPITTFELRFDNAVAKDDEVGKPAAPSPLVIAPALRGKFVWLSRRSGVFTPEEPTALGTVYEFTLREGLRDAAGAPLAAALRRRLETPGFAADLVQADGFDTNNAPARPEFRLQFNAGVSADAARWFIEFRNAAGQRAEASVRHATSGEGFHGYRASTLTWSQRFANARPVGDTRLVSSSQRHAPVPAALSTNQLVVTPAAPLPVGNGWRLVVAKGLPSSEVKAATGHALERLIGSVTPLTLVAGSARNGLREGKRLALQFSKRPAIEEGDTNFARWFSLAPAVSNLTASVSGHWVELRGDFALGQSYTVTALSGLPAAESFTLAQMERVSLTFTPVPPRLYFPAFSTEQLSGGRRQFELVTVNVPDVRLRAKLLDRHTLIHALRGYRSYFRWSPLHFHRDDYYEPYSEVDFNVVPGRTVYQKNLRLTAATDDSVRTAFDWSKLLQGRQHGAVFLVAERAPERDGDSDGRATLGTQTLVQLTDLGLVWKTGGKSLTAYVFSYAIGRPVAGATVRVLTDDNETLHERETDAQGLAPFPPAKKARWLMAELGDDLHAVPLANDHGALPLWNFNLPMSWNHGEAQDRPPRRVLLFSDRPVYRPGETLHLKAIARDTGPQGLVNPAGVTARLECHDSRGRVFFTTNLTYSASGSLGVSVPLPEGALGQYQVQLTSRGGHEDALLFQVQEFKPNAFELLAPAPAVFAPAESVTVPVSAKYLMGKPLTKAKLHWSLTAWFAGFSPAGFGNYRFCDGGRGYYGDSDDPISLATNGEVDYRGEQPLPLPLDVPLNPKFPQPRKVDVLLEMTDLNQQTLSRSLHFTRHSSDFYLGVREFKEVVTAGQPLAVEIITVRADGTPEPAGRKVAVKLQRQEVRTTLLLGAGGAKRYRNEFAWKTVAEREVATTAAVSAEQFAPERAPTGAVTLTPEETGTYQLEVSATDAGGRAVRTRVSFTVSGRSENAWAQRNGAEIPLVADRKLYRPGDTARILAKTPINGSALVTIERGAVLRSFVTNFTGSAPTLSVPITAEDAPNVFVSVLLLRGHADSPHKTKEPQQRLGYLQLKVEQPETRLRVQVLPDATDYRPGQRVTVTADVAAHNGRPVPGAEVTLYAVDEGVLGLTGYATPDPHKLFYAPQPLAVRTHSSLASLLPEDPEQLRFENKGYLIGGGGGEGQRTRKDFLPCAYWNAALVTDSEGRVTATFPAPDSLTRYRVIAVAHAGPARFGSSESDFEVNKPLTVEPALPAFATLGDRLTARAVVHNLTAQPGEVEVTLALDDKARSAAPLTQRVNVAAGATRSVEFAVEFTAVGTAKWTWRARFADSGSRRREEADASATNGVRLVTSAATRDFTDAVESKLRVGHVAPLLREVWLGRSVTAETNLIARANPQLREGNGTATVRVSNTRLTELAEAVGHLLHYPYGCVEQTSSSLLPWLVLRDFQSALPQLQRTPAEMDAVVNRGVNRLLSMQTAGGGLAYWPGGREPMLWGSAYGGLVLALAERRGYALPKTAMDELLKYLSASLRDASTHSSNEQLSNRCLALYTLAVAGRAEPAYHELLYQKRALLSAESRALLALAILESNAPGPRSSRREEAHAETGKSQSLLTSAATAAMAAELLKPAKAPAQGEVWFGCAERELAVRLLAWCRLRPRANDVDVLVEELMRAQRNARWHTTQGNAWALLALTDYAAKVEGTRHPAAGQLAFATTTADFHLGAVAMTFEKGFPLSRATADAPLTLANPERQRLYTQVSLEARARVERQPRQDRGFAIARRYDLVGDDGTLREFQQARVGDRVLVTLRVEVRALAHYVAIEDPLPALFEPLNPEFKSQQTRAGEALGADWVSDFRELRADRALFFRDHLGPGSYTIRYLARVRAAGTATAPAAKIEEMYHPERFGLTETAEVTSRPLE